jgi:hypothetical protein
MKLILVIENKCDRQHCDEKWTTLIMKPWGTIRLCDYHAAEHGVEPTSGGLVESDDESDPTTTCG